MWTKFVDRIPVGTILIWVYYPNVSWSDEKPTLSLELYKNGNMRIRIAEKKIEFIQDLDRNKGWWKCYDFKSNIELEYVD